MEETMNATENQITYINDLRNQFLTRTITTSQTAAGKARDEADVARFTNAIRNLDAANLDKNQASKLIKSLKRANDMISDAQLIDEAGEVAEIIDARGKSSHPFGLIYTLGENP